MASALSREHEIDAASQSRMSAIAAASTTPRAATLKRPARARAASRTEAGSRPPAAIVSTTRNGFPPVALASSPPSSPTGPASSRTADSDKGRRAILRTAGLVARSPSSSPSPGFAATSSSRYVAMIATFVSSTRRARIRTRSSVNGSAQ